MINPKSSIGGNTLKVFIRKVIRVGITMSVKSKRPQYEGDYLAIDDCIEETNHALVAF